MAASSLSIPLLFIVIITIANSLPHHHDDFTPLHVGKELKSESMPLHSGQRIYKLSRLQPSVNYEVKISYPATIPASFSIRLVHSLDEFGLGSRVNRRLLNTEKLIFVADNVEVFVVVSVEAAGVVAKPNVCERDVVLYNIVCDKLVLSIPDYSWWVGVAAILCLLMGFIIPYFFPMHLLLGTENESRNSVKVS